MVFPTAYVTALSSATLRVLAYVFFRWVALNLHSSLEQILTPNLQIPGHQLPPIIYSALLVYLSSYLFTPLLILQPAKHNSRRQVPQTNGILSEDIEVRKKNTVEDLEGLGFEIVSGGPEDTPETPTLVQDPDSDTTFELSSQNNTFNVILDVLRSMLLGLPSPANALWSMATVAINIILVLGVLDVVYRGPMLYQSHELSFSRVGYVSDTSAKILVREPDNSQTPVYVSYRGAPSAGLGDAWKSVGTVYSLSNGTDYTATFTIWGLRPSTHYEYAASNNHAGFFKTTPRAGQMPPGSKKLTFLTSSCIKPRFPYNPFQHPLSIPGLKHLAKWVPELHASFMLFLGDFIYIDVPHRFGTDAETYRREYRQVYSSPDWPGATANLPWLHVIDDHEIANDWDKQTRDPYQAATDPFDIYHTSLNPPPALPNASYFQFTQGPASFFMMDTRRHRDPELPTSAHSHGKSILGQTQLSSLLNYLKHDEPAGVKWKFVISSIPFTRNWRINAKDTWSNYLHERRIILEAMWDVGMRGDGIGVVVLSGDRHEFAATAFPPPKNSKWPLSATVHEFSTSPLSMFYLPLRSYWEVPGEDDVEEVCIKYAPDGNSKFGAIELEEVKGGEQGLLRFRLFIDGVESWDYVLTTPPAVSGGGRSKDAIWG